MLLRKKSITNGTRHQILLKKFLLSKNSKICKYLVKGKKTLSGRSFFAGRITVKHRGGGCKQSFQKSSSLQKLNFSIIICAFYNSKVTSFSAFYYNFLTKKFGTTIFTNQTFPGSLLFSYNLYPQLYLSCLISIKEVPAGSLVHSLICDNKIVYIKSAGCFGILVQKTYNFCRIKMPSGFIKTFPNTLFCVLGRVSNEENNKIVLGKAGKARLRNKRPIVRGVAMNPVDHPHGGQTSGGIPSVTPWGIPTKGKPTRKQNVKK